VVDCRKKAKSLKSNNFDCETEIIISQSNLLRREALKVLKAKLSARQLQNNNVSSYLESTTSGDENHETTKNVHYIKNVFFLCQHEHRQQQQH
jgi:hypothetical protein